MGPPHAAATGIVNPDHRTGSSAVRRNPATNRSPSLVAARTSAPSLVAASRPGELRYSPNDSAVPVRSSSTEMTSQPSKLEVSVSVTRTRCSSGTGALSATPPGTEARAVATAPTEHATQHASEAVAMLHRVTASLLPDAHPWPARSSHSRSTSIRAQRSKQRERAGHTVAFARLALRGAGARAMQEYAKHPVPHVGSVARSYSKVSRSEGAVTSQSNPHSNAPVSETLNVCEVGLTALPSVHLLVSSSYPSSTEVVANVTMRRW